MFIRSSLKLLLYCAQALQSCSVSSSFVVTPRPCSKAGHDCRRRAGCSNISLHLPHSAFEAHEVLEMGLLSTSDYHEARQSPPMAFLNTRWGREEVAGRHRPRSTWTSPEQSAVNTSSLRRRRKYATFVYIQHFLIVTCLRTGSSYTGPYLHHQPTNTTSLSC